MNYESDKFILIDGHAHLHDSVDPYVFLSSARTNFLKSSIAPPFSGSLKAMLCLADYSTAEGFSRFQRLVDQPTIESWQIKKTHEETSLLAQHDSGDKIWLIAGRQVVTSERLEVMGLGTIGSLVDGNSLRDTILQAQRLDALPVLPWGVGKWWGDRGRLLLDLMNEQDFSLIFADNGGRPWIWKPHLLEYAHRCGFPVIAGGDPLRIKCDQLRVGTFGTLLKGPVDELYPVVWTKNYLAEGVRQITTFGSPLGFFSFFYLQSVLRLTK